MLPGISGASSGASFAVAWAMVVTAGSGSYSTTIASRASFAWSRVRAMTAATVSPTKRTTSWASARRGGEVAAEPSGRLKTLRIGIGFTPALTRSSPVRMATTPGIARAWDVSMETMRAWAWGERRKQRWVWDASITSSVNWPAPTSNPRSSIRGTALPLPKRPTLVSAIIALNLRGKSGNWEGGRGRERAAPTIDRQCKPHAKA